MKTIAGRTVNEVYPLVMWLIGEDGIRTTSRNGPVLQLPGPLTITTAAPGARVLFDTARDANPFFHVAEAIWMLAGRDDVEWPARFVPRMLTYSDDGRTLHGAYGARWRCWDNADYRAEPIDQLVEIIQMLRDDPWTRRAVLGFWNPATDLAMARSGGRDVPCNLTATFQAAADWNGNGSPRIDMTVFQRSGDLIWGVTGANAVHLSMLHEFVARGAGGWQGRMHQVVVNPHVYCDIYERIMARSPHLRDSARAALASVSDPYFADSQRPLTQLLWPDEESEIPSGRSEMCGHEMFTRGCHEFLKNDWPDNHPFLPWFKKVALPLRESYFAYRRARANGLTPAAAAPIGLGLLSGMDPMGDWYLAARNWFARRAEATKETDSE
jgi:hypothetical protein